MFSHMRVEFSYSCSVNGYFSEIPVPWAEDLRNYRELTPRCPGTSLTLFSVSAVHLNYFLSQTDPTIQEFFTRVDAHDLGTTCSCGYLCMNLKIHFLWILSLKKNSSMNAPIYCVTNSDHKIWARRTFACRLREFLMLILRSCIVIVDRIYCTLCSLRLCVLSEG